MMICKDFWPLVYGTPAVHHIQYNHYHVSQALLDMLWLKVTHWMKLSVRVYRKDETHLTEINLRRFHTSTEQ